ncbi:MAG: translation initiation factor IF-3 [Candidatus Portnoybacteria bacterium]|nr:translation initiation factor IF-3 [Candidatus Portnoybacteria bacterium]
MDRGSIPLFSTPLLRLRRIRKDKPSLILIIQNSIFIRNRINTQIRGLEVRLIDETGKQLGVVSTSQALRLAQEKGLDLIEVAAKTSPPVCKITDFGKFQYQKEKQARLQKTSQKKSGLKGIRIGLTTARHDLELKTKQAEKFLGKGYKVRIEIVLRGREKAFQQLARQKIEEFKSLLGSDVIIEQQISRQPRGFSMIIGK